MIAEEPGLVAAAARGRRGAILAAIALAAVAVLAAIDLATDAREGVALGHALLEGAIVLLGAAGTAVLVGQARRWRAQLTEAEAANRGLVRDVARAEADAARWRAEAGALVRGLSDAIDAQFATWGLTPSEQEVARLLLKGLSHKEIASVRGGSEATARQQATAIYKKANLAGRAELAAFFLEDLLAPPPAR